jgi:periplasmic protein TonB
MFVMTDRFRPIFLMVLILLTTTCGLSQDEPIPKSHPKPATKPATKSSPAQRSSKKSVPKVSPEVATGLLIEGAPPIYPAIAKAGRVSGTVTLSGIISKQGLIEDLQVVSGPPLLQGAALDAVKKWRYRPYLQNGKPVEVETTVNLIFELGG